jgi:Rod binding domain-containing protein
MDALAGGLNMLGGGNTPFAAGPALDPDHLAVLAQPGADRGKSAEDVASRFEGVFWSMLTKEMRESLEPGVFLGEDTGDVLGGMFDLYMGEHLAQGQTLGIAALIKRQLHGQVNHEEHTSGATDGKGHGAEHPYRRYGAVAPVSGTR